MNYVVIVKVADTVRDLFHVISDLRLGEGSSSLMELHQRLFATNFKHNVHEVRVCKAFQK